MKTHLGQTMSTWKARASTALHDARSRDTSGADGSNNANITVTFLHDDSENHTLVDAELGSLADSHVDAANVVPGIARGLHRVLVALEELVEGEPGLLGREVVPWSGVPGGGSSGGEVGVPGGEVVDRFGGGYGGGEDQRKGSNASQEDSKGDHCGGVFGLKMEKRSVVS